MVFVPVPYTPPQPSPRVKDLSDQLAKVIRDYDQLERSRGPSGSPTGSPE